jgi:GNAT superfamily N-acetyltransferase
MSDGIQNGEESFLFFPLTSGRWDDFVKLLGEKGGCGGCWCMASRLTAADFEANKGDRNKEFMKTIISDNKQAGILAYHNGEPVGWCSVAPRESFKRLEFSRILKRIDDKPVWSITCFFIKKEYRRRGLSLALLNAAINFCKEQGGMILEGYPVIPYDKNMPSVFAWTGILSAFQKAGFVEVARRSKTRPFMRYIISGQANEENI